MVVVLNAIDKIDTLNDTRGEVEEVLDAFKYAYDCRIAAGIDSRTVSIIFETVSSSAGSTKSSACAFAPDITL